jgi:type II secretory pathway predicted ATPase ExeA
VQIILCGQPMLLNTLKTEPMYALNERITRRVVLTPLSAAEVEAYIITALSIAAVRQVGFEPDALRADCGSLTRAARRVEVPRTRTFAGRPH